MISLKAMCLPNATLLISSIKSPELVNFHDLLNPLSSVSSLSSSVCCLTPLLHTSSDTPDSLSRWVIFLLWVYSVATRASKAPNSCSIIIQAAGGRQSILLLLLSSTRVAWWSVGRPCNQKVTGLIPTTVQVSVRHCVLCWSVLDSDIARSSTDSYLIAIRYEYIWKESFCR